MREVCNDRNIQAKKFLDNASLEHRDTTRFVLSRLGDHNVKNAVFKVGRHTLLVDPSREIEGARKFANAALSEPVFGCVGRFLLCWRSLDNLVFGGSRGGSSRSVFWLVFDGGLMRRLGAFLFR